MSSRSICVPPTIEWTGSCNLRRSIDIKNENEFPEETAQFCRDECQGETKPSLRVIYGVCVGANCVRNPDCLIWGPFEQRDVVFQQNFVIAKISV